MVASARGDIGDASGPLGDATTHNVAPATLSIPPAAGGGLQHAAPAGAPHTHVVHLHHSAGV